MRIKQIFLLSIVAIFSLSCSILTYADTTNNANNPAVRAISDNPKDAEIAIKELREVGAQGLQTLFTTYAADIENFKRTGEQTERWQRIAHAIDTVAMQKDVYASNLFWFTDLEKAKAESKRTNKPILSLHLLGNLNEEFSCANSRFFRAILYPNATISKYLQENYILHWKSVRPAPKITIDFGDGRKIERTITGNSIHYILDKNGEVLDALSGLNSPQVFYDFLFLGQNLVRSAAMAQNAELKAANINNFRANKHRSLTREMNRLGKQIKLQFDTTRKPVRNYEEMPAAISAMTVAVTKMAVEMPDLKSITADMTRYGEEQINLEQWKQLARLSGKQAKLDENSIAFIRRQNAKLSEQEFVSMITKLEEYVSIDTTRNEYLLRPTLLVWLAKDQGKDVAKFNEKIYSDLFFTPSADKWLGLYAPDIYTALDGNGIK